MNSVLPTVQTVFGPVRVARSEAKLEATRSEGCVTLHPKGDATGVREDMGRPSVDQKNPKS